MNRLLLATRNPHKVREISQLLASAPILVLPKPDSLPDTVEDEPTLEGNAAKKARECARACGLWSLADDTGLEVAALGGAPGVRSARYAGEDCDFSANNAKLLEALRSKPSRAARFRTVMALCGPSGEPALEEGVLEGEIAEACRGANGFGYDPLFLIPELGLTLAQLEPERKNALSHRGKALRAIVPRILRAFALCALLLLAVRPAGATRTEPGERTIWDEIMASQAQRELRLGAQYLDEKQYEAALDELRRAVAANPQDPQAQMMLGVAYYWTGDVDRSIESYRKSVELAPQDAQPYMLLGISLAYKERIAQAYAAFKKAAELDSSRADIQMNLGSIEESMNRALDALEHFRRAVELAPHEALYHYQLGMLYRRLGRDADAADSLRRAIKDFPEFEDALLALGSVEERSGERAAAIRDFGKAVALKSRDSVARFRLARLLLEDGRLRQARAVLADAFHLTPEEGGAGLQLSISYAGGRSAAKAPAKSAPPQEEREAPADGPLSVFRRNLERVPLDQGALMQVDVLFVPKAELVRGGPGESSLSRALKRQLGQDLQVRAVRRQFHINPGSSLERQRQIDRVLKELKAVMAQAPAGADVRLGLNLTLTRSAQTAAESGGGPGGRPRTPPKVSFQPRQVGNDLGLWIIGTGWMPLVSEVLPDIDEESSPSGGSDWWVDTGLGYAALGDGQRALVSFERASKLDERNEAAWLGLGVAHVMLGDEASAEAALERALRIDPKARAARDGLKWLRRPSTRPAGAGR